MNLSKLHPNHRGARFNARHGGGFTLIELVIVLAIIAILAAIALPSYEAHVMKARRAQGKSDVLELSQLAERAYTVNRDYTTFTLPYTVSPNGTGAPAAYNLTLATTTTTYTLTATPTGAQASDICGILTLDQTGRKTHSAGEDTVCIWGTAP